MKRILQTTVILLIPFFLFSQEGKITGRVTDETTGEPLAGTNILVEGTSLGAATDTEGGYVILGVPVGTYIVRGEFIGYRPMRISNLRVSGRLTTTADFALSSEAIELGVVNVVAERPLIIKDATNTTRIVDTETINKIPVRGVNNLIALQTGAVSSARGTIYVRGARSNEIAHYVDGVYTVNPWSLSNTTHVSTRAMEEVSFQSGGFDAEFGNSNGGMVNTTTRTGSDKFDISAEFVQDLGSTTASDVKNALHSYGYQLYNVNLGGPLGDRIRMFGSYEHFHTDDNGSTTTYFPTVDRTASKVLIGFDYDDILAGDSDFLESVYNVDEEGNWGYQGSDRIDNDNDGKIDEEDERWNEDILNVEKLTRIVYPAGTADGTDLNPDTTYYMSSYANYQRLYGQKPNIGHDRDAISANLLIDLKPLRIKLGGNLTSIAQNHDTHIYHLVNSDNNYYSESDAITAYANFTLSLSANAFLRVSTSYYDYKRERGDHRHKDNIDAYGDPSAEGNEWLRSYGKNPLTMARFVNFTGYGAVNNEYQKEHMSYIGLKTDFVNQAGAHELKAGFEYRAHTIRDYILSQPMEIFEEKEKARINNAGLDLIIGTDDDILPSDAFNYIDVESDDWFYTTYRSAYTLNTGYTLDGEETEEYDFERGSVAPGKPVILGAYIQDKFELEDMILNVGVRFDYYDFGTDVPATYDTLWLTEGRLDRDKSNFEEQEPYSYISPRIGFSFPVTDRTVLHAQYGTFVQHPYLDRLYLSDTRLAANLSQGNMTQAPNGKLKPERTTQYEVGFAQQIGDYVALDITGYYKEVRDYTLLKNRTGSTLNGAIFSWAQLVNGDYGVIKGVSTSLTVRRVRGLMARGSYTMQWANGTGSDPATNWNVAWTGDEYPTSINPLDYDQRHTGSVMVDYRTDRLFGMFELGINALYRFGSGLAYTPSVKESDIFGEGWYQPVAAINSGYAPWTSMVDLRFDLDNLFGTGVSAYVLVLNAFSAENVDDVYPGSGEAGTDGWLEMPEGQVWQLGRDMGPTYYEDRLRTCGRWGSPRIVRFGLTYGL